MWVLIFFKKKISDEEKVLFQLSIPFFSKSHGSKVKSIVQKNQTINLDKVISLAMENEVAGLVYKNAQALNIFPDEVINSLHKFYKETAFRNILLFKETIGILQLLSDNNIATIPLKGASASDLIFNDFGVYPSGDIDILVHPSDLSGTKEVLCQKGGFSQTRDIDEKDLLANHYHLMFTNKTILLEVHWNLVKRYFTCPADFWWQESKEFEWNTVNSHELTIEKYILYNIFRLFDHCFYPLRFFILLKGLIDKNTDRIDWKKLIDLTKQLKMKKLVIFTLRLLKDILDTDIPESHLQNKYYGYGYFKTLVLSGVLSGLQKKHRKMMFYTLLLIAPEIILTIFWGRVFPSQGELRLRYNIPPGSNKIYLYYLLNPFLLLFKKN